MKNSIIRTTVRAAGHRLSIARLAIGASALILVLPVSGAADAAVTVNFYSREMGDYFPHAFITLTGAMDSAPRQPVDSSYGFTAVSVSPKILLGRVNGVVNALSPGYIAGSQRHFSVTVSDQQYLAVAAVIRKWQTMPNPSYDLHKANCVFFVGDVARSVGLQVDDTPKLMTKPRSYLEHVLAGNPMLGNGASPVVLARSTGGVGSVAAPRLAAVSTYAPTAMSGHGAAPAAAPAAPVSVVPVAQTSAATGRPRQLSAAAIAAGWTENGPPPPRAAKSNND